MKKLDYLFIDKERNMRDEFEFLDDHIGTLYDGVDLCQQLLRDIKRQIDICERMIGEDDKEKKIVARARKLWKWRAKQLNMTDTPIESDSVEKYNTNDKRLLRKFGIAVDD